MEKNVTGNIIELKGITKNDAAQKQNLYRHCTCELPCCLGRRRGCSRIKMIPGS